MTTNENGNFTGKVAFVSPEQRAALAARRRWHSREGPAWWPRTFRNRTIRKRRV